ncbi:MAG: hypothetical protein U0667_14280 [Chloroflexota bacterium]
MNDHDSLASAVHAFMSQEAPSAVQALRHVEAQLPEVWPPRPDEERLLFYRWAAKHVSECRVAVQAAYDLLAHVSFWMGSFAEDLETFRETGRVPDLEASDLADDGQDPAFRIVAQRRWWREAGGRVTNPPLDPFAASRRAQLGTTLQERPERRPRRKSERACLTCGTKFPVNGRKSYCSVPCRPSFIAAHRGSAPGTPASGVSS